MPPAFYETKTDTQGAVTVEVKPVELSANAAVWKFEVTLDTHSVELDSDMAASAFLADDSGNEYQPIAWEGDPPGGHHRKGTLTFSPVSPKPDQIRLVFEGIGGVEERMFEWILQ